MLKIKTFKRLLIALFGLFSLSTWKIGLAQKGYEFPDSVKYKKNIIKWNLTPFILWSNRDINISYECVLKPYRSFSINAGYFVISSLVNGIYDSLNIQRSGHKWGFTVSGDYRFYFNKRNKRMAPDGLYWGAYVGFCHYQFENSIKVSNTILQSGRA